MVRKQKPTGVELVEFASSDPDTGLSIVTTRRGFVEASRVLCSFEDLRAIRKSLSARACIEKTRRDLMDHLESKGIPTERTIAEIMYRVDGGPLRHKDDIDDRAVHASGGSIETCTWSSEAYRATEPLTFQRACIDYLKWSWMILHEFSDVQLSIIEQYANSSSDLNMLDGDMNLFAARGFDLTQSPAKARQKKAEKRNNDVVAAIITRVAEEFWQKHPGYRGNPNGTATLIEPIVNAELSVMREQGVSLPAYKNLKDAIRKRLQK